MKKTLIAFTLAVVALSFAQRGPKIKLTDLVRGEGVVTSADKTNAQFEILAFNGTDPKGNAVTGGGVEIHLQGSKTAGPGAGASVMVKNLVVKAPNAEATGDAVLVTFKDGKPVRTKGTATVDVADNYQPKKGDGGPGDHPDTFKIHFENADGSVKFDFAGNVTRGDIAIGVPSTSGTSGGTTGGSTGGTTTGS